jgi:hypothetical protein
MQTIKNLVYVLAIVFGVSFLDGLLTLGFSDGFYTFVGLVEIVCIIWLLVAIRGKK